MKKALSVLAALVLLVHPVCASDGGDWFAVSGATFVESIGAGTSFLLVAKRPDGRFALLAEGEEAAPGMTIKKIGTEQVLVTRGPGQQTAAPILRQQVPADIMITAICRLYNQNLVIGGEIETLVSFSEGLLNYKKELPGLVQSLGLAYHADDRVVLIRKEGIARPIPSVSNKKDAGFSGGQFRGGLADLFTAVETQFQKTFKAKTEGLVATVHSADLTPEELAGYLSSALDTEIADETPKADPAAAAVPAVPPAAEAASTADAAGAADAIEAEFQQAVQVARAGDYKKSAGMLLKSLRSHKDVPAKVTNLLGKLLWSIGKRDMARKAWAHTLKREPGNEFARKALAKTAPRATGGA